MIDSDCVESQLFRESDSDFRTRLVFRGKNETWSVQSSHEMRWSNWTIINALISSSLIEWQSTPRINVHNKDKHSNPTRLHEIFKENQLWFHFARNGPKVKYRFARPPTSLMNSLESEARMVRQFSASSWPVGSDQQPKMIRLRINDHYCRSFIRKMCWENVQEKTLPLVHDLHTCE
jgi:hypothetical protein